MVPTWHFAPLGPLDRARDPSNEAFFTADNLDNISEALVREGIQNSIDAAAADSGGRKVRVRISLEQRPTPKARARLLHLYNEGREHFDEGLPEGLKEKVAHGSPSYLTFEDFGTKGLTGDVAEFGLTKSKDNSFFAFFRAEGRSPKSGGNLGRWGIGKHVFSASSNLKAYFGYSIREDAPTKVLMGTASLQTHSVKGQDFLQDAWYGVLGSEDRPPMPIADDGLISSFSDDFELSRKHEAGLSIVIPFVSERVSVEDLARATVQNFFWPIFQGELVVEIKCQSGFTVVNSETIIENRNLLSKEEWADLEFAYWASSLKPKDHINLPVDPTKPPIWSTVRSETFTPQIVAGIKKQIETHNKVGFKIPVLVRPKKSDSKPTESYFLVYLEKCRGKNLKPKFLRDGILIKNVRTNQIGSARSIVAVEDAALAGLLGDSEGPNHTEWQRDCQKFRGKYAYGGETISFVSRSVFEILKAIDESEDGGDRKLLLDLFYLAKETGVPEKQSQPEKSDKGQDAEPKPPNLPVSKMRYKIAKIDGGFTIIPGQAKFKKLPTRLKIEAGYDVRRGDPFRNWAMDDFVFTMPPLLYGSKPKGIRIREESGNSLIIEIHEEAFNLSIIGFDKHRDLSIKSRELPTNDEEDD